MANNLIETQDKVVTSLLYRALKRDKELVMRSLLDVEDNKSKDASILAGAKNLLYRNNKIDKYQKQEKDLESEINRLIEGKDPEYYNLYYQIHLGNYIKEVYRDDKYLIMRTLLGIEFLLAIGDKIHNEKEVLEDISKIIFDNVLTLRAIKHHLEYNYKALTNKQLTSTQKTVLFGVALASVFALVAVPVLAAGGVVASASVTTAALATAGFADMQVGVGMLALYGFLAGASITGGTYLGLRIYNNAQANKEYEELVKQGFKEIGAGEAKIFLAIKLTVLQEAKKTMPEAEFKKYLSETLELINSVRDENNRLLFIENQNDNNEQEKMGIFHKVDLQLLEILRS